MATLSNPSEIAREALRQLALRRVAPTPDNYRKLYAEIAGTRIDDDTPSEAFLRKLARRLPRDMAERQRLGREFDQALSSGQLKAAEDALGRYLDGLKAVEQPAWNELIINLLRAWEARQQGWTTARKREALERVLNAAEPAALYSRLQGLLRGWNNQTPVEDGPDSSEHTSPAASPEPTRASATPHPAHSPVVAAPAAGEGQELIEGLRKLLLSALRDVVPAVLGDHPELADEASQLANEIAQTLKPAQLEPIGGRIRRLAHRLEMITADDAEVRAGLLELLRLLLRNIDELVLDDNWLAGQIEMLRELVDAPPNPRMIDDAGRRLKDLIY
jgi:diguanylate cyclase